MRLSKLLVFVCVFVFANVGCVRQKPLPDHDIVILFDNDVHCAVNGYATMAAMRQQELERTPYTTVVSCGDFAQGDVMGSLSQGEYIVEIMNSVPYDITTIGNHEFDYGVEQLLNLSRKLSAEVVCCNFSDTTGKMLFPAYAMRNYGGTRVAYIGVATPTTFNTSTPTYFQDSLGNVIYDFHQQDTYELVQKCVDYVRNKKHADYVIVLSHLGDEPDICFSPVLIEKTRGINAVLDGHSHHVFCQYGVNMDGDSVLFTSTGTKFRNIGRLCITTEGRIQSEIISLETSNASQQPQTTSNAALLLQTTIDSLRSLLHDRINQSVGFTEVTLTDRNESGERLVRRAPTNLGHFLCDAFRYAADAQIGVMNGGGIRSYIPQGDITMGSIMSVLPFNNRIWRMTATGQQLLDALEVGVRSYPDEDGDFPHMSGMRITFDPSIPSSVEFDENNLFVRVGDRRRITLLEVETAPDQWQPIHPDSTYTIGGQSYILVSGGAGGMYRYLTKDAGPMMTDVEAVVNYIDHLGGRITTEY